MLHQHVTFSAKATEWKHPHQTAHCCQGKENGHSHQLRHLVLQLRGEFVPNPTWHVLCVLYSCKVTHTNLLVTSPSCSLYQGHKSSLWYIVQSSWCYQQHCKPTQTTKMRIKVEKSGFMCCVPHQAPAAHSESEVWQRMENASHLERSQTETWFSDSRSVLQMYNTHCFWLKIAFACQ